MTHPPTTHTPISTTSVASTSTWPSTPPTTTSGRRTTPPCSSLRVGTMDAPSTIPILRRMDTPLCFLFFLLPFSSHLLFTHLSYLLPPFLLASLPSSLPVLPCDAKPSLCNYCSSYLLVPIARPERPSSGVLGAREVGGQAEGDEDRRPAAALQNRHVLGTLQVRDI